MGKKKPKNQFRVGSNQKGPNSQAKPYKPAPRPDSDSEDSMVLDEPVSFGPDYSASSSGSDNESPMKKEAIRINIQQVCLHLNIIIIIFLGIQKSRNCCSSLRSSNSRRYKCCFCQRSSR